MMQGQPLGFARRVMDQLKQGSTLKAEAQKLGMQPEDLRGELETSVSLKTFRQAKQMNKKNLSLERRRAKRKEVPVAAVCSKVEHERDTYESNLDTQEEPNWKKEQMELQEMEKAFQQIIEEVRTAKEDWETKYEWRRMLQEKLSNKHKVTAELLEAYEIEENAKRVYDRKRAEYYALKDEIRSKKSRILFLVAPGYKGEFPRFGKLISCRRFPNKPYLKVEHRSELLQDVTESDIKAMGYENPYHIKAVLDYAKLVAHHVVYSPKGTKLYILCDDSRVYQVLETQGITG